MTRAPTRDRGRRHFLSCVTAGIAFVAALGAIATQPFAQETSRVVDGRVNVQDDKFQPVFLDGRKFFPGTKVQFDVVSRVSAMRFMYEERVCFTELFGGLWCKYVPTSRESGLGPDKVPLVLTLFDSVQEDAKPIALPHVTEPRHDSSKFDDTIQLPNTVDRFTLAVGAADVQEHFAKGYVLKGRVAPKYNDGSQYLTLTRSSCDPHRNGEYCSQGQFIVTLKTVDTSDREKMLERYLARRRSYAEISSESMVDFFMKNEVKNGRVAARTLPKIAELIVEHAKVHHQDSSQKGQESAAPNEELRRILVYAVSLAPESEVARTELVRYHIKSGSLGEAKVQVGEQLKKLTAAYESGDKKPATLVPLAQALRNAGQIALKDRAAVNLRDVEVANAFYERALAIWLEYERLGHPISANERTEMANVNVDQARVLSLIRSRTALERAAAKLDKARHLMPKTGAGLVSSVTGDGLHFLTSTIPNPIAEVGAMQVVASFLPASTWRPMGLSAPSSRLLLVRSKAGAGQEYALGTAEEFDEQTYKSVSLPDGVQSVRQFRGGVAGVDVPQKEFFAFADGKRELIAKDVDDGTPVAAALNAKVFAFARKTDKGKIGVWRDSKLLEFDSKPDGVVGLAVSADGQQVHYAARSGKSFEIGIANVEKLAAKPPDTFRRIPVDIPDTAFGDVILTPDGKYAVHRGKGLVGVLDLASSEFRFAKLPEGVEAPWFPVSGSNVATVPDAKDGTITELSVLDAAQIYLAGVPIAKIASAQPAPKTTLKFQLPLMRSEMTVAAFASTNNQITLLTSQLPAVLHSRQVGGEEVLEHRIAQWHPRDIQLLSGGKHLIRYAADRSETEIVDLQTGKAVSSYSRLSTVNGNSVNEIIPFDRGGTGGYFRVERNASGAVLSVDVYSSPSTKAATHVLSPTSESTGSPLAWDLLNKQRVKLASGQGKLLLAAVATAAATPNEQAKTREAFDAQYLLSAPQALAIAQIDANGLSTQEVSVRDAASVVAMLGSTIVLRRETGFAALKRDGTLSYLDECGPKSIVGECLNTRFHYRDNDIITIRRTATGFEFVNWVPDETEGAKVSWRCKPCADLRASSVVDPFVGTWQYETYLLGKQDLVVAPYAGALGIGKAGDDTWTKKIPPGKPVLLTPTMVMVQKDMAGYEIWRID